LVCGLFERRRPNSIGMTLLDAMPDAERRDSSILGTVIDPKMIATA